MADIIDHSKFIIGRFDHYFDSINGKGVFYITLNTFLLAGFFSQLTMILAAGSQSWWIYALVLGFVLINISSTIATILSINPFSSSKFQDIPSLIYFGDIACRKLRQFKTEFSNQSDKFMADDLSNQVHQLAEGLAVKFARLRYAGILLFIQFAVLVPIVFVTVLNVKIS